MKRRLFAILSTLSLLLFVAILVLWARSCFHSDSITLTSGGSQRTWYSQWYTLHYQHVTNVGVGATGVAFAHCALDQFHDPSPLGAFAWSKDGCFYVAVPWLFPALLAAPLPAAWSLIHVSQHGLPRWSRHLPWIAVNVLAVASIIAGGGFLSVASTYFAATLVAVPLLLVLHLLPASRRAAMTPRFRDGRCPSCGYDLRATPARCPECGAVPEMINT